MNSIEALLSDINLEIKEADESSLMNPVLILMRDVLRRIGYAYVCEIEEKKQAITGTKFDKTSDMISIIDIGDKLGNYEYVRIGAGQRIKMSYKETLTYVKFFDGETECTVKYYSLPKDEFGIPIIHDSVYTAIKEYAISRLLNSRPEHPDFRNRSFRLSEADKLIDQARSELSANNASSNRFNRKWYKNK